MATVIDPLGYYTAAALNLAAWESDNADLLAIHAKLKQDVADAEAALKTQARKSGACENDWFSVTVTYKSRKWYDTDYILEHAPWVREIPGVVVQTVDKARIEALAKAKAIDADVCDAALREEALTPAVSIKRKEKDS